MRKSGSKPATRKGLGGQAWGKHDGLFRPVAPTGSQALRQMICGKVLRGKFTHRVATTSCIGGRGC
eukprot:1157570-Pelagomonas_calceolata.AAC.11